MSAPTETIRDEPVRFRTATTSLVAALIAASCSGSSPGATREPTHGAASEPTHGAASEPAHGAASEPTTAVNPTTTTAANPTTTTAANPTATAAPAPGDIMTFHGMCDASGAVPLEDTRFAVADDEDNLLRVYDATRGGAPLAVVDVGAGAPNAGEMDLEAATRIGRHALWLGSHGRNKRGEVRPTRLELFVTTAPTSYEPWQLVGRYHDLLDALARAPELRQFELATAAELAPDALGGLNIEGMTARPDGGVIIGFRNPIPEGRAIIVGIANPVDVAAGRAAPRFDAVHRLDLGGRGIRGLSWWRGSYLVIGGSYARTGPSRVFRWDGASDRPEPIAFDFAPFNPEAFYTPEERDLIMVLSDDGEVLVDGTRCKKLANPAHKRFRGVWLRLD